MHDTRRVPAVSMVLLIVHVCTVLAGAPQSSPSRRWHDISKRAIPSAPRPPNGSVKPREMTLDHMHSYLLARPATPTPTRGDVIRAINKCQPGTVRSRRRSTAPPPPPPPPPSPDEEDDEVTDVAWASGICRPWSLRGGDGSTTKKHRFRGLGRRAQDALKSNNTTKPFTYAWLTHKGWTHDDWWERLPGGDWNPVTIWWRVKQKGPYTQLGLNHMNPICKIIAFQLKEMLYLQTFALMGQVSKVIDKSLRPKLTEENWWDLFYYSIFTVIHMKQIYKIMQEKTPVQFSLDDLELFDLVFQPNQFSPRQFDALKKLGVVRTARKGDLLAKAGEPMTELLVLIHGQCSVIVNGKVTNIVKPGGFIGELEFLRGEESVGEAATDKAPHFVADAAKHAAPASSLFSLGYLANIWESATRAALSGAEAVGFFSPATTRESFLAVDRRASEADPHMLSTWRDDGVMGVGIPVATSTSRRDGADGPRKPWHTGAVDITVEASSPVTYLAWRFDVLYHFIQTDKKIALRLEAMLAKDLANKVLQTDTLAKTKGKDNRDQNKVASRVLHADHPTSPAAGAATTPDSPSHAPARWSFW